MQEKKEFSSMSFGRMRKSNCQLCDGWGVVTVLINNEDYAKACTCKAGDDQSLLKYKIHSDKLKYPVNMELTEEEQKIYESIRKEEKVEVLSCPF